MEIRAHFTDDADLAEATTRAFLHSDPLRHNVICTLLAARGTAATPIRYWWATVDGEVRGVVLQSPETFPAVVSHLDDAVVGVLARATAEVERHPLPGVNGLAIDAARFAGEYTTATRRGARPVEGQRIYEVRDVTVPSDVPGAVRLATEGDRELVAAWLSAFDEDTGLGDRGPSQAAERAGSMVGYGRLYLWESAGAVRASAFASPPAAGVVRIGFVYTPPPDRRRGHASALVAAVSQRVLGAGDRCILYTQLSNPTSNAVYQRLGYRPIGELVRYAFDDQGGAPRGRTRALPPRRPAAGS